MKPTFRHSELSISEPEQFGIAMSGVSLAVDFLARQEIPAHIEQFQAPGWALDFQETHVKARVSGPLPPGWVALGLMRKPTTSSWYGYSANRGTLVCNPPGEPIDGLITPGFSCISANVPVAIWEKCRALAGIGNEEIRSFAAFQLPVPLYESIERRALATRRLLRNSVGMPRLSRMAASDAVDLAIHIATTAWEFSASRLPLRDSFRNRARLAKRAESWIREHLAEVFRIPDVCLSLRVSRRELEYAFRSYFDQSPRDFLQALRLNAVRASLHCTNTPVTDVAFSHGISHLSRFAAQYRALFGESPSQTTRAGL